MPFITGFLCCAGCSVAFYPVLSRRLEVDFDKCRFQLERAEAERRLAEQKLSLSAESHQMLKQQLDLERQRCTERLAEMRQHVETASLAAASAAARPASAAEGEASRATSMVDVLATLAAALREGRAPAAVAVEAPAAGLAPECAPCHECTPCAPCSCVGSAHVLSGVAKWELAAAAAGEAAGGGADELLVSYAPGISAQVS